MRAKLQLNLYCTGHCLPLLGCTEQDETTLHWTTTRTSPTLPPYPALGTLPYVQCQGATGCANFISGLAMIKCPPHPPSFFSLLPSAPLSPLHRRFSSPRLQETFLSPLSCRLLSLSLSLSSRTGFCCDSFQGVPVLFSRLFPWCSPPLIISSLLSSHLQHCTVHYFGASLGISLIIRPSPCLSIRSSVSLVTLGRRPFCLPVPSPRPQFFLSTFGSLSSSSKAKSHRSILDSDCLYR